MRRRCLLSLLVALPLAGHAHDASYGNHGMALFGGRDGLYASHLPMFHAPHDTQVVLRVHLADPRIDAALRARLDGRTALWTLDPERFELSRLAPGTSRPLRRFRAQVVQGHFEQGGQVRFADAGIVVDEIMLYRPLAGVHGVLPVARYVPVGAFLVKLIDSRPDVDHIVRLARPVGAPLIVARAPLPATMTALARLAPLEGTVYYGADDLR
jgi:hypothetical protein